MSLDNNRALPDFFSFKMPTPLYIGFVDTSTVYSAYNRCRFRAPSLLIWSLEGCRILVGDGEDIYGSSEPSYFRLNGASFLAVTPIAIN